MHSVFTRSTPGPVDIIHRQQKAFGSLGGDMEIRARPITSMVDGRLAPCSQFHSSTSQTRPPDGLGRDRGQPQTPRPPLAVLWTVGGRTMYSGSEAWLRWQL